jgi:hypothetical protein
VKSVGLAYEAATLSGIVRVLLGENLSVRKDTIRVLSRGPSSIDEPLTGIPHEFREAFVFELNDTLDVLSSFSPVCKTPSHGGCAGPPMALINGVGPDAAGNIDIFLVNPEDVEDYVQFTPALSRGTLIDTSINANELCKEQFAVPSVPRSPNYDGAGCNADGDTGSIGGQPGGGFGFGGGGSVGGEGEEDTPVCQSSGGPADQGLVNGMIVRRGRHRTDIEDDALISILPSKNGSLVGPPVPSLPDFTKEEDEDNPDTMVRQTITFTVEKPSWITDDQVGVLTMARGGTGILKLGGKLYARYAGGRTTELGDVSGGTAITVSSTRTKTPTGEYEYRGFVEGIEIDIDGPLWKPRGYTFLYVEGDLHSRDAATALKPPAETDEDLYLHIMGCPIIG